MCWPRYRLPEFFLEICEAVRWFARASARKFARNVPVGGESGRVSINDHVRTGRSVRHRVAGQSPRTLPSRPSSMWQWQGDPPGFAERAVEGELGIAVHPEHEDAFQYWVLRPGFYVQGAKRVQIPYVKMNSTGRACCKPPHKESKRHHKHYSVSFDFRQLRF